MRMAKVFATAAVCVSSCALWGQAPTQASWVGVWNGTLDGVPGVTLTLADNHGQLGGTVVFNVVMKQPEPHVGGSDAVMVEQPQLNGDTLTFQVYRSHDAKQLQIVVKRIDSDHVSLSCPDCGGGPMAMLTKFEPRK